MRTTANLVLLGALLLPSQAPAQTPDTASTAVSAAQVAARSWLRLVDRRRYGASWDSAAALFRDATTKAAWTVAVRQTRKPLDPLGPRRLMSAAFTTGLPNAPPGQYVVLQYETRAGRGQTVVETVTPMLDADGVWRVSGYYVRPR